MKKKRNREIRREDKETGKVLHAPKNGEDHKFMEYNRRNEEKYPRSEVKRDG